MSVIKTSYPSIPLPQRLGMGGSDVSMARMNICGCPSYEFFVADDCVICSQIHPRPPPHLSVALIVFWELSCYILHASSLLLHFVAFGSLSFVLPWPTRGQAILGFSVYFFLKLQVEDKKMIMWQTVSGLLSKMHYMLCPRIICDLFDLISIFVLLFWSGKSSFMHWFCLFGGFFMCDLVICNLNFSSVIWGFKQTPGNEC
jgi:hypothetical protein